MWRKIGDERITKTNVFLPVCTKLHKYFDLYKRNIVHKWSAHYLCYVYPSGYGNWPPTLLRGLMIYQLFKKINITHYIKTIFNYASRRIKIYFLEMTLAPCQHLTSMTDKL